MVLEEENTVSQKGSVSRKKKDTSRRGNVNPHGETSRRQQLVQIAFDLIASRGFEGLRFQEVAASAGINNATLYYYFPSKEALIQGVVDSMMERLKTPQGRAEEPARNALEELRQMFAGARDRLTEDPSFFVVITELALRARRDPAINRIGEQRDNFWVRHLTGILERGIAEGVFRSDLDREATAAALMVQMKGIAHHAAMRKREPGEIDAILSGVAVQVEHWLTCEKAQGYSGKSANLPRRAATAEEKPKRAKTARDGTALPLAAQVKSPRRKIR
jgi:AcrR family transcriptional regulator